MRYLLLPKRPLVRKSYRFLKTYRCGITYAATRANTFVLFAATTFMQTFTSGLLSTCRHNKKRKRSFQAGVDLALRLTALLTTLKIHRCHLDCRGRLASRTGFIRTLFRGLATRNRNKRRRNSLVSRREPLPAGLIIPLGFVERTPVAHNGTKRVGLRRL
jgi:hypothetical protein